MERSKWHLRNQEKAKMTRVQRLLKDKAKEDGRGLEEHVRIIAFIPRAVKSTF